MSGKRELIAASVLTVVAAGAGVAGYVVHGQTTARSCTFDGGGRIASGDAARTTEGTVFTCQDGTLVKIADAAPRCPAEDSCTADYRNGAWHITPVVP